MCHGRTLAGCPSVRHTNPSAPEVPLSTCKLLLDKNSYALHTVLKTLHPLAYAALEKEVEKRPVPRTERERFIEGRWQCERLGELVKEEREQPVGLTSFGRTQPAQELLPVVGSTVIYITTGLTGTVVAYEGKGYRVRWDGSGLRSYVSHDKVKLKEHGSWKVGEDGLARKQSLPPETPSTQPASNLYEGSVTFTPEPGMQVFASFKRKRVRASVLCVGPKSVKLLLEDGTRFETSQELTLVWWPGKVNSSP